MSLLNKDDDTPGTGLASSLFGTSGAGSAAKASMQMTEFGEQALDILRGNLAPYAQMGEQAVGQAALLADPMQQAMFLANNPIFQNMASGTVRDINASAAARGKLESGGTAEQTQSALIKLGNDLIDQQLRRLNPLAKMGQASAARRGAGSVDLLTGIGNAQSAATMAGAAMQAQGTENAAQIAGGIAGYFAPDNTGNS